MVGVMHHEVRVRVTLPTVDRHVVIIEKNAKMGYVSTKGIRMTPVSTAIA